jgi:hypothetical protein
MCQEHECISRKKQCICEPAIDNRLLSKNELLIRLKEYKMNLESELDAVNKNLESSATAEEGGD